MFLTNVIFVFILFQGGEANKLCCATPFKIQGFLSSMSFGYPTVPYQLMSGDITILDGRRANIADISLSNPSPFGFWVALLTKDLTDAWSKEKGLDLMGDYRDKLVRLAVNGGGDKCTRYTPVESGVSKETMVMLPSSYRWKDVSWIGIYDYGSKSIVNHAWVQSPNRTETLDTLNQCLVKSCWRKANDPEFCTKELKPCTDPKIDCADKPDNYCYFQCEKHTKADTDDNEKKMCSKARVGKKLFGCTGTTTKDAAITYCD